MPRTIETALSGYELLTDPLLNKGTAFTDAERDEFDLHGLLPPYVTTSICRSSAGSTLFAGSTRDLQKYVFLRGSQDTNETLFYALLTRHIEEMMPIVYTPTVGLGCQHFSRIFRQPRGLFLSYPIKDRIPACSRNRRFDGVEVIVVSDGERILGLGDQGAGGMGIPIGKLSLYTACAGLHPSTTLPVLLDVGTDNRELLDDPLYIGWRHERVRGADYDDFVATFVDAVRARWPHVLLHWEDFAVRQCQPAAGAISGPTVQLQRRYSGDRGHCRRRRPQRNQRHRACRSSSSVSRCLGAGSAGTGICALLLRAMIDAGLSEKEARGRFYLVDRDGLIVEGMPGLQPFQARFAQSRDPIAAWKLSSNGRIGLADVVANARTTVLIGTSGQAHAFSEPVVRAMAAHAAGP